jgi:hypothetical protein
VALVTTNAAVAATSTSNRPSETGLRSKFFKIVSFSVAEGG